MVCNTWCSPLGIDDDDHLYLPPLLASLSEMKPHLLDSLIFQKWLGSGRLL